MSTTSLLGPMTMQDAINAAHARVVIVKCASFGLEPVVLSQKAYADFIRLADRHELLNHNFEFTSYSSHYSNLSYYGSIDLNTAFAPSTQHIAPNLSAVREDIGKTTL